MKKIVTIIGARPQFIKAAAVSRAIQNKHGIEEIIIHTGQHFDENMSHIFFKEMDIPEPNYHLEINSLSHGAMTGRMLEKIEEVLLKEKPDAVLVYGDTNSTLAGALASSKLHIPLCHVEAGLRSFNMSMPEEINRILTDRISDILFCPTAMAFRNLQKEGFDHFNCRVLQVGDVMYDAALYYGKRSSEKSNILNQFGLEDGNFNICTIHRQENTDDPETLKSIISSLNEINKECRVILPLHPRTKKIISNYKLKLSFDPINPLGYFDIIELLKHCKLVITDSGGMQKEAYFFNKFCITVREETEWIELVENNYNFLSGANSLKIQELFGKLRNREFVNTDNFYGDGNASEKIIASLF